MIYVIETADHIRVTGHARYAARGSDIVCAAISALTVTLATSLKNLTNDTSEHQFKDGDAIIRTEHVSKEQLLLIDAFFIGCELLADSYPDHVYVQRVKTVKAQEQAER